ncbi:hypothetical protein WA158_003766 [Blastocystis sp. Blastoise]
MKALILVGGYGTRLRPLTFSKPKPLVEFCNLPILYHQIEALSKVGVTTVVLAVSYLEEQLEQITNEIKEKYNVDIVISLESTPMGTAGPIALARKHLEGDEPFFVFNSDVTCRFPLSEMLEFHKRHNAEGTIMVTEVSDPTKYGVVVADSETDQIERFVEKPKEYVGNHINAGLYILNPSVIDRIPLSPTSIEKVIFPQMAKEGTLYSMLLPGFWMDIGQPKDYITGVDLTLQYYSECYPNKLSKGENIKGNALISPKAKISPLTVIGPNVVIGDDCVVEDHVTLSNCTLHKGCHVHKNSIITFSILGWENKVMENCVINHVYTGFDVTFKSGVELDDYSICPNKTIGESNPTYKKVIM